MSFTLWRGVVGMVRPTRRPGTLEELIRILPEGIGLVPLLLNFKAGSNAEFLEVDPAVRALRRPSSLSRASMLSC